MSVSVVIPTRNRITSLNRALKSIYLQTTLPKEIIIIDSSDAKLVFSNILNCPKKIKLIIKHSKPSVCLQRNIGIDLSTQEYILLCDDDIEFDVNYITKTLSTFKQHKTDIVSGLILEKDEFGRWTSHNKTPKTLKLLYAYIFGLPLFCNFVNEKHKGFLRKYLVSKYQQRGNHLTKACWPIMTNMEQPFFKSTIYGLGASLFKSSVLKNNKYDAAFYNRGIGDNYDVAIRIKHKNGVLINTTTRALHHKEKTDRYKLTKSYFYRGLALSYIINKISSFKWWNKLFFIWSILGASILFFLTGKFQYFKSNTKLFLHVLFCKNPYISKFKKTSLSKILILIVLSFRF